MTQCQWCQAIFEPRRTGGSPSRFCRPSHRNQYFAAARAYADQLVRAGRITVEELKVSVSACTEAADQSET